MVLIWLHDYGKVINFNNQHETMFIQGKKKLVKIGFSENFINKAIKYAELKNF